MGEPTNVYAEPTRGEGRLCELPDESQVLAWHPVLPTRQIQITADAVYVSDKHAASGYRFTREDFARSVSLMTITGEGVVLSIPLDKKRTLPFSKTSLEAIEEWLGPHFPEFVWSSVRSTWMWNAALGLFFVVTTRFARMSPIDAGWLVLGTGMLLSGVLARVRPRVWIWWLNGVLFGVLAVLIAADVFYIHGSYWRLPFVPLFAWSAAGRFRLASHVRERFGRG
ncbi:MAG: hypothetical protein U0441_02680 [Polyangiaceae bacterium]